MSSLSRGSALVVLGICLIAPQGALAWGPQGHRLIGEIAERYLSHRAREKIAELLRDDRLADGSLSHRTTLGEIANWADEIKEYAWGQKRARWHFDDIPLCGAAQRSHYCRRGVCASVKLAQQIAILGDANEPLLRRNQALKWVVHLVGDIHQPLHAADNGDRGGNDVLVSFFGETENPNPPYRELNLHAVWDERILARRLAERGGEQAFLARTASASQRAEWERGTIADWVAESHRLAVEVAYGALPGGFACGTRPAGVVSLGSAYDARAAPVVEAQIRKAGVRLARILNETLR